MGFRFRIWMPLTAVLIVLLSIGLMFLYGVPAVRGRLSDSAQSIVVSQAVAMAESVSGTQGGPDLKDELRLAADSTGGEVILVKISFSVLGMKATSACCRQPSALER